MQKENIFYSNPAERKRLLNKVVHSSEIWKRYNVLRIVLYSLAAAFILASVVMVKISTDSFEEFLSAVSIFIFIGFAAAAVPWAIAYSRKAKAYYLGGAPFTSRANETIRIEGDIFEYSYCHIGMGDRAMYSGKKAKAIDLDMVECIIHKEDITDVTIYDGRCRIDGKWMCKSKYVESIDFKVNEPTIKEKNIEVPSFEFLLDFELNEVKHILRHLGERS